MQQIKTAWTNLDRRKQVIAGLAALGVFLGVLALSRMVAAPEMKLLYAGLESNAAGEVVQALEQRGIVYQVRGGSIYVPAGDRDQLRMTLAGDGLPSNGNRGYELLDSLNGFGTTAQMFDAAYWRAKEGELARTIVTSPHVSQVRVHIASNGTNPFRRTVEPTASVFITPAGPPVTSEQAQAIRFLVASAVAGLSADRVAVIDATGGVVEASSEAPGAGPSGDRAEVLRERVLRLLEARVGPGNAVVEVSVETVTETESIRERRIDPDSRVAIRTDSEERSNSSVSDGGDVTVASNLPDSETGGAQGSNARNSETRERVNYEVSATELEIHRVPGAIRRLTVAVLVNGLPQRSEDGQIAIVERAPEELEALQALVASAVGFDAERGDQITLKSMELPTAEPLGTAAGPGWLDRLGLSLMPLVKLLILSLVILVLGLFVLRPLLARPRQGGEGPLSLPAASQDGISGPAVASGPVLTGEIEDATGAFAAPGVPAPGAASPSGPGALTGDTGTAVERLRALIAERQEETVEILRGWLDEKEEAE